MIQVYHGSYLSVPRPELSFSREALDFGKGFYVTPIREQAERWAERAFRRHGTAFLNIYSLDLEKVLEAGYRMKEFPEYNDEWLDFIMSNRQKLAECRFDIVCGGVANDKVFNTIELYFDDLIDKAEALKRLKFELPNEQICILKQEILDGFLSFDSSEEFKYGSQ